MHQFGLSTALGAFVAGVVLAEIALPARARKRRRAVPLDPARAVLPVGRHAARPQARSRARPLLVIGLAAGVIVTKTILITP